MNEEDTHSLQASIGRSHHTWKNTEAKHLISQKRKEKTENIQGSNCGERDKYLNRPFEINPTNSHRTKSSCKRPNSGGRRSRGEVKQLESKTERQRRDSWRSEPFRPIRSVLGFGARVEWGRGSV